MDIATEFIQQQASLSQQARQVHTITDRFSMANTYLINDEQCIVIDPCSALNTHLTLQYLQRFLHRTPHDIDLIVLTHLHHDHTPGIEALHKTCNAPVAASIVAQQQVHSWIADGRQEIRGRPGMSHFVGQILSQQPLTGTLHPLDLFSPRYEQQLHMIDVWLEDVVGLPNHPNWHVIASPGHTPESLCLYNPFSYELVCGDSIVTLAGKASLARSSANRRILAMTLQTLRSLHVLYLYPGHGRPILSNRAITNINVD